MNCHKGLGVGSPGTITGPRFPPFIKSANVRVESPPAALSGLAPWHRWQFIARTGATPRRYLNGCPAAIPAARTQTDRESLLIEFNTRSNHYELGNLGFGSRGHSRRHGSSAGGAGPKDRQGHGRSGAPAVC